MVPEAQLESTEHGLVPKGDGWFVLNVRQARWREAPGRGAIAELEGEPEFPQLGVNVFVLRAVALLPPDVDVASRSATRAAGDTF